MNESEILPAPVIDLSPPPQTKWDREHNAFLRLLPQLLETHSEKYVAIHEGQVIDVDDNLLTLAPRVYATFGYIPIYMDRVTEKPRVVRAPHIRNWEKRSGT